MELRQARNPTEKTGNIFYREFLTAEFREAEGHERRFQLSFSSEEPYTRYWGKEVLDHSEGAIKIERLLAAGCVLFNHNRDYVVGKIITARVENLRTYAEIEFDEDEPSELIYQKVKNKTLRGVSTGYMVGSWEKVLPGKVSGDGRFTGPCDIARSWEPFEISIVSCPADYTVGVGRELMNNMPPYKEMSNGDRRSLEWFRRQMQLDKYII